jgi:Tfp pilus assembly protein PilO
MTARDRTILVVLAGVLLVAGFWFFGLKPKRAEITAAEAQIATQQSRLQSAESTLAAGRQAKADYPRAYAEVAKLGAAVPVDDDLPSLLYQLDTAAHGADVDFRGLNRAASSGGSGAPAAAAGSSTATAAGSTGATSALPPGATVGTAGLATLPFNLDFSGSFFDLERFLAGVQGWVRSDNGSLSVRGRLLTIDGVSLTPGTSGLAKIQAKVAATAYLSPDEQAAGAASGAAPSASGGTTAPTAASPTSSAITEGGSR